jgi:AraC-like DNA-binding protein
MSVPLGINSVVHVRILDLPCRGCLANVDNNIAKGAISWPAWVLEGRILTALATAIQPLWPLLEGLGEDPRPIFSSAGIEPEILTRPNARLPVAACNAVWVRASSRVADPCFGVRYGEYWQPSMFGPLGYAWLTSTTLRKAIDRFARYIDLVLEKGAVLVEDLKSGDVRVVISYQGSAFTLPALADALLSLLVRLCRLNYGYGLNPKAITLFHSEPPSSGLYFEYFKCPVEFDAKCDSVTLSCAVVDMELPSANPYLANLNEQETVKILAGLDKNRVVDRVQAIIIDALSDGDVTSEAVADKLHMSTRTLSRQLQQEGTSFKALLERTRFKLATAYLSNESLSITQIAFMLGFSDQGSFTRAYKRWTGQAPSASRA